MDALVSDSRYLGFNDYGITEREAKQLCGGTLPRPGYEHRVVAPDGFLYWIGRITFKLDSWFRPVAYGWRAMPVWNWAMPGCGPISQARWEEQ